MPKLSGRNSTIIINHEYTDDGITWIILTLYLEDENGNWYTLTDKFQKDKFIPDFRGVGK